MYSRLRLVEKYLHYYLKAANGWGHGIHSPFVYDFVRHVLRDRTVFAPYPEIEGLRRKLLRDGTQLEVTDMGAGSGSGRSGLRSVASIARDAAKSPQLGQLLFRLARYYRPAVVVELGTSLGLSAAYLAAGLKAAAEGEVGEGSVWTIEGCPAIAGRAAGHLSALGLGQVEVVTGNFDDRLKPLLEKIGPVELAFVDGNHRREPTLRYFNSLIQHAGKSALLIFDDIHWSAEMEAAWKEIREDRRIPLSIDLFFVGLVVFREEFKVKQDFQIRF